MFSFTGSCLSCHTSSLEVTAWTNLALTFETVCFTDPDLVCGRRDRFHPAVEEAVLPCAVPAGVDHSVQAGGNMHTSRLDQVAEVQLT